MDHARDKVAIIHANSSAAVSVVRIVRSAQLDAELYESIEAFLADERPTDVGVVVLQHSLIDEKSFQALREARGPDRDMLPVILLGIFMISGAGSADAYGDNPGLGTVQAVVAGLLYALFILFLRESGRGHTAPPSGPLLDATIGTAAVALLIGSLTESDFSLEPSWPLHGWLLLLALVAQVVGWLIITRAMPHLPALDTSILLLGQPMLAILWAGMIFDESLGTGQWIGVLLVLTGLTIFSVTKEPSADTRQPAREKVDDTI